MVKRISKSKINTYDACPHNYKLMYVDKLPMPKSPFAASRGVNLHNVIDDVSNGKYGKTIQESTINAINKFPDFNEALNNFRRVQETLSDDGVTIVKPVFSEEKIYDPIDDVVVKMDAVFYDGDQYILIDYKSGKVHDLSKFQFELAMYTYYIEKDKNITLDQWGIYFVDHHVYKHEKRSQEKIDAALNKIENFKLKVKMKIFPKKPMYRCSNCISYINGHCKGV